MIVGQVVVDCILTERVACCIELNRMVLKRYTESCTTIATQASPDDSQTTHNTGTRTYGHTRMHVLSVNTQSHRYADTQAHGTYAQTDKQTDGRTDRRTDRKTDRRTDGRTDRRRTHTQRAHKYPRAQARDVGSLIGVYIYIYIQIETERERERHDMYIAIYGNVGAVGCRGWAAEARARPERGKRLARLTYRPWYLKTRISNLLKLKAPRSRRQAAGVNGGSICDDVGKMATLLREGWPNDTLQVSPDTTASCCRKLWSCKVLVLQNSNHPS